MEDQSKRFLLCAGTQSGGTTIVSWCFLQRGDTDGALDMSTDTLQTDFSKVVTPNLWVKMTISAFRWTDAAAVYKLWGYRPEPLLVVRNPFESYASLKKKWYGKNDVTAEDPPLALRFARFLEDWREFKAKGWPIICYERFVDEPRAVLEETCRAMNLLWDESMVGWPKALEDAAYVNVPNETFAKNLGTDLFDAVKKGSGTKSAGVLSPSELSWLSSEFEEMNREYGYTPGNVGRDEFDDFLPRYGRGRRARWLELQKHAWKLIKNPYAAEAKSVFDQLSAAGLKKCALYGAGEVGRAFLAVAQNRGVRVSFLVDRNPALWGTEIDGVKVVGMEQALNSGETAFVVASVAYRDEIKRTIAQAYSAAEATPMIFTV